jgi:hypothetical protein
MRTDPLQWRNTTRAVRLFVRAAFSGLSNEGMPVGDHARMQSALFCFGAIDAAARLGGLSPFARRRIELALLRRSFGLGLLDARWSHRELLCRAATTPRGRHAHDSGRVALREWFRGSDPAARLRDLIGIRAGETAPGQDRIRAPLRQRPTAPAGAPLRAHR